MQPDMFIAKYTNQCICIDFVNAFLVGYSLFLLLAHELHPDPYFNDDAQQTTDVAIMLCMAIVDVGGGAYECQPALHNHTP